MGNVMNINILNQQSDRQHSLTVTVKIFLLLQITGPEVIIVKKKS